MGSNGSLRTTLLELCFKRPGQASVCLEEETREKKGKKIMSFELRWCGGQPCNVRQPSGRDGGSLKKDQGSPKCWGNQAQNEGKRNYNLGLLSNSEKPSDLASLAWLETTPPSWQSPLVRGLMPSLNVRSPCRLGRFCSLDRRSFPLMDLNALCHRFL